MSLYFFQRFCKASDGAFNATKIDEGLSNICLLQMKGVMGVWVAYMTNLHFGA